LPNRPIGVTLIAQLERAASARMASVIGVSMKPGPIALTRMPCVASSCARHFVSIQTPALLTL
jgi:hypothetical protein